MPTLGELLDEPLEMEAPRKTVSLWDVLNEDDGLPDGPAQQAPKRFEPQKPSAYEVAQQQNAIYAAKKFVPPAPNYTREQLDEVGKAGKMGGKIGGKKRAELLTPERRREIAQKAAAARWAKA